jgi:hypothetical protein
MGAFYNKNSLKRIEVSVTEILSGAFNSCKNLEEVNLNAPLEKIGSSTFTECDSLTKITIPSTVRYIDPTAFDGNLKDIYLPYHKTDTLGDAPWGATNAVIHWSDSTVLPTEMEVSE